MSHLQNGWDFVPRELELTRMDIRSSAVERGVVALGEAPMGAQSRVAAGSSAETLRRASLRAFLPAGVGWSRRKTVENQRRALVTSLALTLVAGERAAAAAEPSVVALRISESAPEECPKTPSLRERLAAHLGRIHEVEAQSEAPAIDLVFRIEPKNGLHVGTVTITSAGVSVERSASSASCEDVYAALSVMAAIAIGEEQEPRPIHARKPSEESAAEPTTDAPRPPTALPRTARVARVVRPGASPSSTKRIEVGLGAGPEVNGNRGLVLMATWFAQISLPFESEPTLRVGLARSSRERLSSPQGDIAIQWSEVTFAACANLLRHRALRIGPCVSSELGRLEASLLPPLHEREFSYLWLTLGGSARVTWQPVPQFSIELISGARAPLLRKELYFEPHTEPVAYRAPAVSPFVAVGIVAHLP